MSSSPPLGHSGMRIVYYYARSLILPKFDELLLMVSVQKNYVICVT